MRYINDNGRTLICQQTYPNQNMLSEKIYRWQNTTAPKETDTDYRQKYKTNILKSQISIL